tara:strand:- start:2173 stop:2358 length:186 start_codon:yes stop_codon:yes gene_type:complete
MVKDAMNATFFPFLSPILDDDERVKKGFITGFSSSTYTVFSLSLSRHLQHVSHKRSTRREF